MFGWVLTRRRSLLVAVAAAAVCAGLGVTSIAWGAGGGHQRATAARASALLPYQNPRVPLRTRVNDLLKRMTLEEKIGQMT